MPVCTKCGWEIIIGPAGCGCPKKKDKLIYDIKLEKDIRKQANELIDKHGILEITEAIDNMRKNKKKNKKENSKQVVKEQKKPKKNESTAVWDLVISDMKERDNEGKRKYKTRLQSFNGRNALVDAYQENLDEIVYIRQAIEERWEMIQQLKYAKETIKNLNEESKYDASHSLKKLEEFLESLGEL